MVQHPAQVPRNIDSQVVEIVRADELRERHADLAADDTEA